MILLDANILVRMCNNNDADYARTIRVVFLLRKTESQAISPQVLYEFWAVATRDPINNGLGMSKDRARRWLTRFTRLFTYVPEPETLLDDWAALVYQYDVKGFRAHDARHAALMKGAGIQKLMTYNVRHFAGLPVTIVDPGRY